MRAVRDALIHGNGKHYIYIRHTYCRLSGLKMPTLKNPAAGGKREVYWGYYKPYALKMG
jgi:hypothetical protein